MSLTVFSADNVVLWQSANLEDKQLYLFQDLPFGISMEKIPSNKGKN